MFVKMYGNDLCLVPAIIKVGYSVSKTKIIVYIITVINIISHLSVFILRKVLSTTMNQILAESIFTIRFPKIFTNIVMYIYKIKSI